MRYIQLLENYLMPESGIMVPMETILTIVGETKSKVYFVKSNLVYTVTYLSYKFTITEQVKFRVLDEIESSFYKEPVVITKNTKLFAMNILPYQVSRETVNVKAGQVVIVEGFEYNSVAGRMLPFTLINKKKFVLLYNEVILESIVESLSEISSGYLLF